MNGVPYRETVTSKATCVPFEQSDKRLDRPTTEQFGRKVFLFDVLLHIEQCELERHAGRGIG